MAETSWFGLTAEAARQSIVQGEELIEEAQVALSRRGHFRRRPSIYGIDLELASGVMHKIVGEMSLEELDRTEE